MEAFALILLILFSVVGFAAIFFTTFGTLLILIGSRRLKTAPFYWNKGFAVTLPSSKPLTKKYIQRNNEIGHWINENVVVRLCAISQSHNLLSEKVSIDKSIEKISLTTKLNLPTNARLSRISTRRGRLYVPLFRLK
jgi:hypothetical protein